ncbi:cop9 signalosome complex subunit [Globomyces sp. JEL0801]|nr:cop9 signalosome complex subunit [Globomyces sp. JEL0801]
MDRESNKKLKILEKSEIDLENYISPYKGHAKIDRLLFISNNCPSLRVESLRLLIPEYLNTGYIDKYQDAVRRLNHELESNHEPTIDLDVDWISKTSHTISEKMATLESELASYKSNLIKESIRMGHNDLGDHYYYVGDLQSALKCYTNTRDYLTIPYHIVEMCMNIIQTSLELNQYHNIQSYILKIRQAPNIPEKEESLLRLFAVSGLIYMESASFKAAAKEFLQVPFSVAESLWKHINAKDIAIYGGLCALSSFDRQELKSLVIDNADFKQYLELEPQIRDLIYAFYSSKFSEGFRILENLKNELSLDMYLNKHIESLFVQIRNRALIQYCMPFVSVDMHRMKGVFGYSIQELEANIAQLIASNSIDCRIDSHNKIIRANQSHQRTTLYNNAIEMGKGYQIAAK